MPSLETINLCGTIVIFLLLALSLKNVFFGLLAYFLAMASRIGLHYPALGKVRIELTIALIVLIATFISRKNIGEKCALTYNPVNKYMFCFFCVIMASFVQTWDYAESWEFFVIEFIKVYVFFVMIVILLESEQDIRLFLWVFALVTIWLNYEGLFRYFSEQHSYQFQGVDVAISSKGFAAGHVAAANMQLQCLPVMIYLAFYEKKLIFKIFACILSVLSVLGVIASGSRGGFLGLIVIGILFVYFSKKRTLALLVCSSIFIVSLSFLPGNYMGWMGSIVGYADDSATSRITGLINGIEMMIRRPILGVGPGCYRLARKAWFGWGLESHNHYGQVMGDLGLAGTIAWGFFIVYVFKNLSQAKKVFQEKGHNIVFLIIGIQVALIVRLFEGMFSHSLYIFFWYVMAALSIALLKVSEKEDQYETA